MMLRKQQLANQLREVFIDGKWIANTNFKEQLESINWEQAVQKVYDLNSIALLTYHINYYLVGLIGVFNGKELNIKDRYSFDMSPIQSEAEWMALVNKFLFNAEAFANQVEQMDEALLNQVFVDEKYGTYSRNIEAVVLHAYYHLGQISLIKKIIRSKFNNHTGK